MHTQYWGVLIFQEQLEFDLELLLFKIWEATSIWDRRFQFQFGDRMCIPEAGVSIQGSVVNCCCCIESANSYFIPFSFCSESFFCVESCLTIITMPFRVQSNIISLLVYIDKGGWVSNNMNSQNRIVAYLGQNDQTLRPGWCINQNMLSIHI